MSDLIYPNLYLSVLFETFFYTFGFWIGNSYTLRIIISMYEVHYITFFHTFNFHSYFKIRFLSELYLRVFFEQIDSMMTNKHVDRQKTNVEHRYDSINIIKK